MIPPNPGVILCFHGLVAQRKADRGSPHLSEHEFEQSLALLRFIFTFVPLSEMLARLEAGRSVRGLASVTFDDAYQSVAHLAAPILRRLRIPFALFPTLTGTLEPAPFWWDRLEALVHASDSEALERFATDVRLPEDYRFGHAREGLGHAIRQWLLREYRGRPSDTILDALGRASGEAVPSSFDLPMSAAQLQALYAAGDVEIGIHTSTHPVIPLLSEPELHAELEGALSGLHAVLPAVTPVLAIPYGYFDRDTVRTARRHGCSWALSVTNQTLSGYRHDGALPVPRLCAMGGVAKHRMLMQALGASQELKRRLGRAEPPIPQLPSETN